MKSIKKAGRREVMTWFAKFSNDKTVVAQWRIGWRERFRILVNGAIWISIPRFEKEFDSLYVTTYAKNLWDKKYRECKKPCLDIDATARHQLSAKNPKVLSGG